MTGDVKIGPTDTLWHVSHGKSSIFLFTFRMTKHLHVLRTLDSSTDFIKGRNMETFVQNCKIVAQIILVHSKISDILINGNISKSFCGLGVMKISSLADGYTCLGATYDQHFQNKITTITFRTFSLTDQRSRLIGITRGRAQCWWMLVLICLWYNDQNKWELNRSQCPVKLVTYPAC
jgi:hypothetical protein